MACHPIIIDGKPAGFICTSRTRRRTCADCGAQVAEYKLCDWRLAGAKKGKTCSRVTCNRCATSVGPDKDLCRPHAAMWAKHPLNPKNYAPKDPEPT